MAQRSIRLAELGLTPKQGQAAHISGLTVDSRAVKPGFLFAALPGSHVHGAQFIETALGAGATAILTDATGAKLAAASLSASTAALIVAEDPRETLARAAALWFGAQPERMVAVIGHDIARQRMSDACDAYESWGATGLAHSLRTHMATMGLTDANAVPASCPILLGTALVLTFMAYALFNDLTCR